MIKEFGAIIGDPLWVTRLFTPAFVATVRYGRVNVGRQVFRSR
ncbi:hypothetical protein [Hamadaea tsunoensis]|nr:hypothetical protein [Hamadaea tsunoensis]